MNKFAEQILNDTTCNICPRKCGARRSVAPGFCGAKDKIIVSKIMVHNWEEPFLTNACDYNPSHKHGSGAIFFSGCNLKCVYCQNYEISNTISGKEVSPEELVDLIKTLESKNVCNINLVTPTHFVNQIIQALKIYKPKIPVIYNTSGYELESTIKALEGLVDIFLFDFKYFDNNAALRLSSAHDYPEICKKAMLAAKNIAKNDIFNENGIMQKGIVIRHLLLPNHLNEAKNIIQFIYDNLGKKTYFSLLNQYMPCFKAKDYPEINRKIKPIEYKIIENFIKNLDMPNVFVQDLESADSQFIPNFSTFCDF